MNLQLVVQSCLFTFFIKHNRASAHLKVDAGKKNMEGITLSRVLLACFLNVAIWVYLKMGVPLNLSIVVNDWLEDLSVWLQFGDTFMRISANGMLPRGFAIEKTTCSEEGGGTTHRLYISHILHPKYRQQTIG